MTGKIEGLNTHNPDNSSILAFYSGGFNAYITIKIFL